MNNKIFKITAVGILSGLSVVLVMLVHFPIFPTVAFLEYDPADIPIFIVTAFLGPASGILMTAVVSIIQGVTVSAQSGVTGIIMHIFATSSFVLAESVVLWVLDKSKMSKVIKIALAMSGGVVAMTIAMSAWNVLVTPFFMGIPLKDLFAFMPFIIAFNFIKAAINGAVAAIVYIAIYVPVNKFTLKKQRK